AWERGDAVHRVQRRTARQGTATRIRAQREPDRAREALHDVLGGIERRYLDRRRDRRAGLGGLRLLGESQVRRRRGWRRRTGCDVEPGARGGRRRAPERRRERVTDASLVDVQ